MKKTLLVLLVLPLALWGRKKTVTDGIPATARPEIAAATARAVQTPHPRLFADKAGFAALKARAAQDEYVRMGVEHVRDCADALLDAPPVVRELEGRRLLGVKFMVD